LLGIGPLLSSATTRLVVVNGDKTAKLVCPSKWDNAESILCFASLGGQYKSWFGTKDVTTSIHSEVEVNGQTYKSTEKSLILSAQPKQENIDEHGMWLELPTFPILPQSSFVINAFANTVGDINGFPLSSWIITINMGSSIKFKGNLESKKYQASCTHRYFLALAELIK
jgi:hypothetical protein